MKPGQLSIEPGVQDRLEALDQLLQHELRRGTVRVHVVPLLSLIHACLDYENGIRYRQGDIHQAAGTYYGRRPQAVNMMCELMAKSGSLSSLSTWSTSSLVM